MRRSGKSIRFIAVVVCTSMPVGVLVGLVVGLSLLGLSWSAQLPTGNRLVWVYFPAIGAAFLAWFYTFWLFLADELTPEDMWNRMKNYLQDD